MISSLSTFRFERSRNCSQLLTAEVIKENPGDLGSPGTPLHCEKAPKSLSAFSITWMHGLGLGQGSSGLPQGPESNSSLLLTVSTLQTVVLLASTQLVGTLGSSPKKERWPPDPMVTMIAAIRMALDHQGGSLSRLQARGHTPDQEERGSKHRMRTTCLKLSSWPLGWQWPYPRRGTSPAQVLAQTRPSSEAFGDHSGSNGNLWCLQPGAPYP